MASSKVADEKHGTAHAEVSARETKRQKTRRICAKWWWLFFLIFAAIVLVVVLPIIYVAYPKMARDQINHSRINVTAMTIESPHPDSVQMSFEQLFISNSKYHPTLYPFNASFYLLDNEDNPPFASIQTPRIKAGNGVRSEVPTQQVNITHVDEFTRYVLLSLSSDEYTIALRGDGELKLGGLPKTDISYNQNITMKGFNRLEGFELIDFKVLNETEADGTNAIGSANIPNPTVQTIDMGTVTLDMSVNGTDVGYATIESLVLKPGDNIVEMRAEVFQLVVVGIVLQRQNPVLPVDIAGNRSVYDGQVVPYYTTMLQSTHLQVQLNVSEAVEGSGLIDKRALAKLR